MVTRNPPIAPPRATAREDHADVISRLDLMEGSVKLVLKSLEDIMATMRSMKERDDDNERATGRLAADFTRFLETNKQTNDALIKSLRDVSDANTSATKQQTEAVVEALKQSVITQLGRSALQFATQWLLTGAFGAAILGGLFQWFKGR